MFPRSERLGASRSVIAVMRKGVVARRGEITLFITTASSRKAAIVVDKKVSKHAVVRNKVKRQLRHILRAQLSPTTHAVIRAYPGVVTKSYQELSHLVAECLRKQR